MIALYKPGNTHIIRGIPCISQRFKNSGLKQLLNDGWKVRPEDTIRDTANCSLSVGEIRKKARELKIKNYNRRPIDELLHEINNHQ